jgi:LmbE family N-acetylglucosaminyl deacetylase
MGGSPRAAITHRVNVRQYAAQKQAALAAHRSQHSGSGRAARLMRLMVRLPVPVFRVLLGYEWFAEANRSLGFLPRDQRTAVDAS